MTTPLPLPKKKDPVKRTRQPTLPPANRSREAQGLTAMAAAGRFALQVCADCGTVQYPPRQICGKCLADVLEWRDVPDGGTLLAETTLQHSNDLFFRDRLPWRLGVVRMDAGPSVVAHLAEDCRHGERVRLSLDLDRSGNAVVTARPETPNPNEEDDLQLREMAIDPKNRRVLIVDGKSALGPALAQAFADAGARDIYVGHAQPWKSSESLAAAAAIKGVTLFPLDVTDTDSVRELSSLIGAKVEILVNNSNHVRMGGVVDRFDLNTSRDELEIHYHGLMRLAGTFGPVMRARGGDGAHGAGGWVNVLSAYALVNNPDFGTYAASQAAALSLSQCLRAELTAGGIRVVNAFVGPLDDEWHQMVPPPKLEPAMVARRIVDALKKGQEDVPIGAVAEEMIARLAENPKEIERAIRLQRFGEGRAMTSEPTDGILVRFLTGIISGKIRVVDLTMTLQPDFPTITMPPELGQSWPFRMEEISRYDHRGPAWYWNNLSCGEHTGTHFDAPIHWISGKDLPENATDTIPVEKFLAQACVVDCSAQAAADPDFLLTVEQVEAWEAEHGRIPPRSWLLMRTDWSLKRDPAEYMNMADDGAHTPGPHEDLVPWLIEERDVIGFGCEAVGTDAGQAPHFGVPFPCHYHMHGNNRFGLPSLTNLDRLPPQGAVLITPPLKIRQGSGSPARVLALVEDG